MTARLLARANALRIRLGTTALRHASNITTAFSQIWANKGRSLLTTLGIIIAVTAIITVVAFVQGFGDYMSKMLRGYGTKQMIVRSWTPQDEDAFGMGRVTLDMDDVRAVAAECPHISRITPFIFTETDVSYGRAKATQIAVRGVSEDYQVIRNYYADAGRFFGPIDVENSENVCVLGRTMLKLLECDESVIGEHILIRDQRFRVVGILQTKGSFMGEDQDQTVMIPYSTALNLYTSQREDLRFLCEASDEKFINEAEGELTRVLRRRHKLEPGTQNDFQVQRQDQMLKQFDKIRMAVTALLAGIVSISLIVGGIGIMNVMFVSVTERTKEIGLRKSVGARRRDILAQFLTEAVVLSTTGGGIGIALGYAFTYVASLHPKMVDISVPMWSVALATGFSLGAGMLFGILPAFKASILHPIDALRHE
ncbi:MAG: ABC transporter permease [Planctomycetes bacterium]|nr:ABC transporter permease [Planctomycetota bacterium]